MAQSTFTTRQIARMKRGGGASSSSTSLNAFRMLIFTTPVGDVDFQWLIFFQLLNPPYVRLLPLISDDFLEVRHLTLRPLNINLNRMSIGYYCIYSTIKQISKLFTGLKEKIWQKLLFKYTSINELFKVKRISLNASLQKHLFYIVFVYIVYIVFASLHWGKFLPF